MSTLRSEKLYESPTKRIRLSIWKDSRGRLTMHLQELDVNPDEPSWESFAIFQSWSATVAREPVARATRAAVQRFYDAHIASARQTVAARVAILEGSPS